MGLQYNVQFMDSRTEQVLGWNGDVPRTRYEKLVMITGMLIGRLAQEGFSQLVDRSTAVGVLALVGDLKGAIEAEREIGPGIWRITIA